MKEHGITYKIPMIMAKKAGLKTVTRRPIKPQPDVIPDPLEPDKGVLSYEQEPGLRECYGKNNFTDKFSPYKLGDLLYTKENFQIIGDMQFEQSVHVTYRQDGQSRWVQLTNDEWEKFRQWKQPYGKKSKLFMFKSLARYWDEITDIEAERVQDISDTEARNEGLYREWDGHKYWFLNYTSDGSHMVASAIRSFQALWDSMYAGTEFAWEKNPWVWVFRYRPIDTEKRGMKAELRKGIL